MNKILATLTLSLMMALTLTGTAQASTTNATELLIYTNQQRATPLTMNETLSRAAYAKANDMIAKQYWAHQSPDGSQPWDFMASAGYRYSIAGENLAYAQDTSQQVVAEWMNSPSHRDNMLNPRYTEVGFAVVTPESYMGHVGVTLTVAMYASPPPVLEITPPTPEIVETLPEVLKVKPTISDKAAFVKANHSPQPQTPEGYKRSEALMLVAFGALMMWTGQIIVRRLQDERNN